MKIKISELTGAALNWAVAKADQPAYSDKALIRALTAGADGIGNEWKAFSPSTDWEQGGPIIEGMFSQGLRLHTNEFMPRKDGPLLIVASLSGDVHTGFYFGPTPLVAAMRCYVASKLGDEVEVPDELCD